MLHYMHIVILMTHASYRLIRHSPSAQPITVWLRAAYSLLMLCFTSSTSKILVG